MCKWRVKTGHEHVDHNLHRMAYKEHSFFVNKGQSFIVNKWLSFIVNKGQTFIANMGQSFSVNKSKR